MMINPPCCKLLTSSRSPLLPKPSMMGTAKPKLISMTPGRLLHRTRVDGGATVSDGCEREGAFVY